MRAGNRSKSALSSPTVVLVAVVLFVLFAVTWSVTRMRPVVTTHGGSQACDASALHARELELEAWDHRLKEREAVLDAKEHAGVVDKEDGAAEHGDAGGARDAAPAAQPGSSSDGDVAAVTAAAPDWLSVPCRSSVADTVCSGHGTCNHRAGACQCADGWGDADCGVKLPKGVELSRWTKSEDSLAGMDPEASGKVTPLSSLFTAFVVITSKEAAVDNAVRPMRVRAGLQHAAGGALRVEFVQRKGIPGLLSSKAPSTPYVLVIDPEVEEIAGDANLHTFATMLLTTDVDVLGFLTARHRPLTRHDIAVNGGGAGEAKWSLGKQGAFHGAAGGGSGADDADDPVLLPGTRHLEAACLDMHLKHWQLKHVVPAFGYQRHERYVMYCDRTSRSIAFRTGLFAGDGPWKAATLAPKSTVATPLRAPAPAAVFNATMKSMYTPTVFATIKEHNAKLERFFANGTAVVSALGAGALKVSLKSLGVLAERAPTRLPGAILVGTCAECILFASGPTAPAERHHGGFAERFQVEIFHDADGRVSEPVCVKSGGIYGHSNRGLYAPVCHRLQRQRDFLTLAKAWMDPAFAPLPATKSGAPQTFGISLHHGNLFGALRFREELLWETDGDFDFVAFNASHDQMMKRWTSLIAWAEKSHGFTSKINYPEKPWYVQFLRNKTDFQCNARSPLDERTRGRPPQQHLVSVDYQGRRVFMNGFGNPWRGIRSDPGHDYRGRYLAQQGWVLHFTKDSIGCKVDGHNACLPACNAWHLLLDHNRCSDGALRADTRNPLLLYDAHGSSDADVTETAALAEERLWRSRHSGLF